eukprot:scaffold6874_cov101-Isochrysis_galbana.AAC.2
MRPCRRRVEPRVIPVQRASPLDGHYQRGIPSGERAVTHLPNVWHIEQLSEDVDGGMLEHLQNELGARRALCRLGQKQELSQRGGRRLALHHGPRWANTRGAPMRRPKTKLEARRK